VPAERRRLACAVESRRRTEPLHGTASRVTRWLLVEQPGPWGREALTESHLDSLVARTLASQSRRHSARVLLVRHPAWRSADTRTVYLARSGPERGWIEELGFTEPRQLLRLNLGVLGAVEAPGLGRPGPATVHLVCTNGRHDQCCANFGRPVVRALDGAGTPDVWESSHVGGDRFAANVVCLPSGVYFGRVPPDAAATLLADFSQGLLDLDLFRGRSCYPPLVQAAEVFARREVGERRLDAVRVEGVVAHGPDRAEVLVRLDGVGLLEVEVERRPGPEEHLTCSAGGVSRPWTYHLVGLRRPGEPLPDRAGTRRAGAG
jgi:Sucrase/ferredoxin-like